jgi:hypothetical protein
MGLRRPLFAFCFLPGILSAQEAEPPERKRPVEGILDNSFFIEEAYNQEPGVVQHIFNAVYSLDRLPGADERRWDLLFTQEWPVWKQDHQLSYTFHYGSVRGGGGSSEENVDDFLINYRYQAYYDERTLTALAPRMSLVIPTGDAEEGFGSDTLGYLWNLPFSTTLGDRWSLHLNAGVLFLPDAGPAPRANLVDYFYGGSAIFAATRRWHFMLEWIGIHDESRLEVGSGTERGFVSLISPGVRHAIDFKNDSQLVLGLGFPIGLTSPTPDWGLFFYLSFEHFFWRPRPAETAPADVKMSLLDPVGHPYAR